MGDAWRQASYAAVLALVLIAVLPLHHHYRLDVLGQPARLFKAVLPVAGVFVTWDIAATAAGQWHFDPAQTFAGRLWGLPLEEYAFFVVIPFAGILTLEAVTAARARRHKS